MKKSDVLPDVKSDIDIKRLFKTVNEISHYLDQQRNRIRTTTDLFSNAVESQRARLCSYVEKLIFLAPLEYGRKCEEILWRKCFYDLYTILKRLKKQDAWTEAEVSLLVNLLNSGIGFYQNLITRLHEEFNLNLDGVTEFPMYKCNYGLSYYSGNKRDDGKTTEIAKIREWAETCVHRNLLYIGDLNRYMFDLHPGWDISVAYRYYLKAQYLKPDIGMPHNQLGTLSNSQNLTLDAVYRYLRCLYCKELFDGAEGNLIAILEQYPPIGLAYNSLPLKKRIFSQFLHLIGVWFLQKSPIKDVDQLCLEFVENINIWFPDEMETTTILKHDPTSLQSLIEVKQSKGFDLPENEHTVFKVLVIFIICHDKLNQSQRKGVTLNNTTTTIIVAVISKAIECIANKIKERLPTLKVPSSGSKKLGNQKMNRRRRRRRILRTQMLSDDELSDNSNVSPDCDDSDEDSEENLIFDEYSDDELIKSNSTNGHSVSHRETNGTTNGKSPKMINNVNVDHVVKFFQEYFAIMQVIKISCDWLQCNKDVLSPIASWKTVFENFSFLLNYANLIADIKKGPKDTNVIPLSEDVELKGLQAFNTIQDTMCWKWDKIISLNEKEEMKQRLAHLCTFGKFLTTVENSSFTYDDERNWFSIREAEENAPEKENKKLNDEQRGKLMKEMGQLWLEAEVKNLESKMKLTAKTNLLTPYLVVDCEALTQHCILVKKLVSSRQFVLLIPTAVVSALDELKRTSGRARDAIRWLESQFRQGNRFLRMQRNNEKQAIPAVSYPRKKDNEAWLFMQIMECCYYLNHTNLNKNNGAKKEDDSNFVRLLTGSRALSSMVDTNDETIAKDKSAKQGPFSMAVVKKSTGLLIEHIVDFYGKWKDSTKSRG